VWVYDARSTLVHDGSLEPGMLEKLEVEARNSWNAYSAPTRAARTQILDLVSSMALNVGSGCGYGVLGNKVFRVVIILARLLTDTLSANPLTTLSLARVGLELREQEPVGFSTDCRSNNNQPRYADAASESASRHPIGSAVPSVVSQTL